MIKMAPWEKKLKPRKRTHHAKSKEERDFYKIVECSYEECDCEEYQEAVLKTQEEKKAGGGVRRQSRAAGPAGQVRQ